MAGWIYAVQCAGYVKLGFSRTPAERVYDLQKLCPLHLQVLGVKPGDLVAESRLHRKFADNRRHGEWFVLTDALREHIEEWAVGRGCRSTIASIQAKALKLFTEGGGRV